jgi:hypothetical protein
MSTATKPKSAWFWNPPNPCCTPPAPPPCGWAWNGKDLAGFQSTTIQNGPDPQWYVAPPPQPPGGNLPTVNTITADAGFGTLWKSSPTNKYFNMRAQLWPWGNQQKTGVFLGNCRIFYADWQAKKFYSQACDLHGVPSGSPTELGTANLAASVFPGIILTLGVRTDSHLTNPASPPTYSIVYYVNTVELVQSHEVSVSLPNFDPKAKLVGGVWESGGAKFSEVQLICGITTECCLSAQLVERLCVRPINQQEFASLLDDSFHVDYITGKDIPQDSWWLPPAYTDTSAPYAPHGCKFVEGWMGTYDSTNSQANPLKWPSFQFNVLGESSTVAAPTTTVFGGSASTTAVFQADQLKGRTLTFQLTTTTKELRGVSTTIQTHTENWGAGAPSHNPPVFTVDALPVAPVQGDLFNVAAANFLSPDCNWWFENQPWYLPISPYGTSWGDAYKSPASGLVPAPGVNDPNPGHYTILVIHPPPPCLLFFSTFGFEFNHSPQYSLLVGNDGDPLCTRDPDFLFSGEYWNIAAPFTGVPMHSLDIQMTPLNVLFFPDQQFPCPCFEGVQIELTSDDLLPPTSDSGVGYQKDFDVCGRTYRFLTLSTAYLAPPDPSNIHYSWYANLCQIAPVNFFTCFAWALSNQFGWLQPLGGWTPQLAAGGGFPCPPNDTLFGFTYNSLFIQPEGWVQ